MGNRLLSINLKHKCNKTTGLSYNTLYYFFRCLARLNLTYAKKEEIFSYKLMMKSREALKNYDYLSRHCQEKLNETENYEISKFFETRNCFHSTFSQWRYAEIVRISKHVESPNELRSTLSQCDHSAFAIDNVLEHRINLERLLGPKSDITRQLYRRSEDNVMQKDMYWKLPIYGWVTHLEVAKLMRIIASGIYSYWDDTVKQTEFEYWLPTRRNCQDEFLPKNLNSNLWTSFLILISMLIFSVFVFIVENWRMVVNVIVCCKYYINDIFGLMLWYLIKKKLMLISFLFNRKV